MHLTPACGPVWCATNSGCITVWQTWPQKETESTYSTPRYAAIETMTTLAIVSTRMTKAVARCDGSFRSTRGHLPRQPPMGIRTRPTRNKAGSTRKNTTPRYGFVCRPNRSAKKTARNSMALNVASTPPMTRSTISPPSCGDGKSSPLLETHDARRTVQAAAADPVAKRRTFDVQQPCSLRFVAAAGGKSPGDEPGFEGAHPIVQGDRHDVVAARVEKYGLGRIREWTAVGSVSGFIWN